MTTLKKTDLVALILELAAKHGTKAHKALKKTPLGRRPVDELRALAAEIGARASKGKVAHFHGVLFMAGGSIVGPYCLVDAGTTVGALASVTTKTTKLAADVTCKGCRKAADLDDGLSADEQAEEDAQVAEAAEARDRSARRAARREAKASGRAPAAKTPRTSSPKTADPELAKRVPEEGATIFLPVKGVDHVATLHRDGSVVLEATGERHATPSSAARAAAGCELNGWARFRFVDEDGETYPINRLRGRPAKAFRRAKDRRPELEAKAKRASERAARDRARLVAMTAKLDRVEAEAREASAEADQAAIEASSDGPVLCGSCALSVALGEPRFLEDDPATGRAALPFFCRKCFDARQGRHSRAGCVAGDAGCGYCGGTSPIARNPAGFAFE